MALNPRAQVVAIATAASLVLLTDLGVAIARSGDDSSSTASSKPSPSASPTAEATASPAPVKAAPPTGNVAKGNGFTMELPAGWKAVPLDPTLLKPFLADAAKSNPKLAAALRSQVARLPKKFDLFAVNERSGSDFAENVNVLVIHSPAPLDALEGAAEQAMKSFGATDTTVKMIQLSQGPAVETTYSLDLGSVTVAGVQHYVVIGEDTFIVTYSALERSLTRDRTMSSSITPS